MTDLKNVDLNDVNLP